jgi:hypothetical protein
MQKCVSILRLFLFPQKGGLYKKISKIHIHPLPCVNGVFCILHISIRSSDRRCCRGYRGYLENGRLRRFCLPTSYLRFVEVEHV